MSTSANQFWSPDGVARDIHTFDSEHRTHRKSYDHFWTNTRLVRAWRIRLGVVAVVVISVIVIVDSSNIFPGVLLALMPYLVYVGTIKYQQGLMTQLMLAKKKGWIFTSVISRPLVPSLKEHFPELYRNGRYGEMTDLYNVFWGKVATIRAETDFCMAKYYSVSRNIIPWIHVRTTAIFHLEKNVQIDLVITPEKRLGHVSKDVELESNEFNNLFRISSPSRGDRVAHDVFFLLNPAVMASLLDFKEKYGSYSMVFRGDMMAVRFKKNVFTMKYTNFFKSPEIDGRDIAHVEEMLTEFVNAGNEIAARLD